MVSFLSRKTMAWAPFVIGSVLGLAIWDRIRLPFRNPLGVVGKMSELGINPYDDFLSFLVFLLLPVLFLFFFYTISPRSIASAPEKDRRKSRETATPPPSPEKMTYGTAG